MDKDQHWRFRVLHSVGTVEEQVDYSLDRYERIPIFASGNQREDKDVEESRDIDPLGLVEGLCWVAHIQL
jgi:hypothetical protein